MSLISTVTGRAHMTCPVIGHNLLLDYIARLLAYIGLVTHWFTLLRINWDIRSTLKNVFYYACFIKIFTSPCFLSQKIKLTATVMPTMMITIFLLRLLLPALQATWWCALRASPYFVPTGTPWDWGIHQTFRNASALNLNLTGFKLAPVLFSMFPSTIS